MGKPAVLRQKDTGPIFRIAGLTVAIAGADVLREWGDAYLADGEPEADLSFDVTEDAHGLQQKNPDVPWEKCLYAASASRFYMHLLPYNGFVLHASAVVLDGKAYLFSADSGTGKSTHAFLWCKHFGSDRAYILNDDKPIIRKVDGQHLAYGAPWCGSSGISVNHCAPIQGLAFIHQCKHDWIRAMPQKDALIQFFRQSDPTIRRKFADALLTLLSDFMGQIPVFQMGCTVSENAVLTAYRAMERNVRATRCLHMA